MGFGYRKQWIPMNPTENRSIHWYQSLHTAIYIVAKWPGLLSLGCSPSDLIWVKEVLINWPNFDPGSQYSYGKLVLHVIPLIIMPFFAVREPEKEVPKVCHCENGGSCVYNGSTLNCKCPTGNKAFCLFEEMLVSFSVLTHQLHNYQPIANPVLIFAAMWPEVY